MFESSDILEKLNGVNKALNQKVLQKNVLNDYYKYTVRNAKEEEFDRIGDLLVEVYSSLKGFPKQDKQPEYYQKLKNVGQLTQNGNIELLVAVCNQGQIGGAVVYFNDMADYGSGGTATQEKDACGFRLLGVDPKTRGLGIGRMLTDRCLQ